MLDDFWKTTELILLIPNYDARSFNFQLESWEINKKEWNTRKNAESFLAIDWLTGQMSLPLVFVVKLWKSVSVS